MQHLFSSDEGRRRLAEFAAPGLLCAFDFDGTLTPIISHPGDVRLPEDMRARLARLQEHAPVAIVTGRSLADIAPRLGFTPDLLVGNHGLEGLPGARAAELAELHLRVCAGWRRQLDTLLAAELPDPGIEIEDKRYSLSVHYRHARAPEAARAELEPLLLGLEPSPRVVAGKCVYNLMPADAGNKGTAMATLIDESAARAAVYIGDDVTDEDVFRVGRADLLSIRVDAGADDSAASYYLRGVEEVGLLVEQLTERLGAAGARNWLRDRTGV